MFKYYLVLICVVISLSAEARQDPTRPLMGSGTASNSNENSAQDGELVLQSIINASDETNIKAIISGKLVVKGDYLGNYQVTRIEGKSVVLQSPEHAKTLTLFAKPIANYK